MTISFRSDSTVRLLDYQGGDSSIVRAARVSSTSTGENVYDLWTESAAQRALRYAVEEIRDKGLIGYLMREKHGSPFEHNSMTFSIDTQIFTAREQMRHRVGFSYNERSGRYSELEPVFWVPDVEIRGLVNEGKASAPKLVAGSEIQKHAVPLYLRWAYQTSWWAYKSMLALGVANEVARAVLPVGIYTQYEVTMNLRSAFNFLSLRVLDENAVHVSRPQQEIHDVAVQIEEHVAKLFPIAYEHFIKNGRVAP